MDSGKSWRRLLVALLIALVANVEFGQLLLSFPNRQSLSQVAEWQLCLYPNFVRGLRLVTILLAFWLIDLA